MLKVTGQGTKSGDLFGPDAAGQRITGTHNSTNRG